jgi:hypothetical protein
LHKLLYNDTNHLNRTGAQLLTPSIKNIIQNN